MSQKLATRWWELRNAAEEAGRRAERAKTEHEIALRAVTSAAASLRETVETNITTKVWSVGSGWLVLVDHALGISALQVEDKE